MRREVPEPSDAQVQAARDVTGWYLSTYYMTREDAGVGAMFCDPSVVGSFAVEPTALAAGEPAALFRLLVAVTMFQRRQDRQIARILRGIAEPDARSMYDLNGLLDSGAASGCRHLLSLSELKATCDLTKDPSGVGVCTANPSVDCLPKRHTVLLKRYGHFGKVPTGLALAIREAGAADLEDLHHVAVTGRSPPEAAAFLERALTRAWRVSDKIAAMFLSILTNSQLSTAPAPWAAGVDSTRFVVIDSNVDLFLAAAGYDGPGTYDARRRFVSAIADRVDLSRLRAALHPRDPRIVQQAMFMFMSASNRRGNAAEAARRCGSGCGACAASIEAFCPMRAP